MQYDSVLYKSKQFSAQVPYSVHAHAVMLEVAATHYYMRAQGAFMYYS